MARSSPVAAHLLQHSSTVNRRPVPYKACHPASSQTPDAPRASICTSQPCFVVAQSLFLGQRTTWKLHPSIPRSRRMPWQQMEKSSVAVPQPKAATFPSREGTDSGQPRQVKGPQRGRGPWIFTRGRLAQPGQPRPKGKVQQENLSWGPQVALPCLMHIQEFTTDIVGLQRQRLSKPVERGSLLTSPGLWWLSVW